MHEPSVTEITSQIYGVFLCLQGKNQDLVLLACLYHCCLFVLDMEFGVWCVKEEIDNSSEALQMY